MVKVHLTPDGTRPAPAGGQQVDGDALGLHGEEIASLALQVLQAQAVGDGNVLQDDLGRRPDPSHWVPLSGHRRERCSLMIVDVHGSVLLLLDGRAKMLRCLGGLTASRTRAVDKQNGGP
jgi:hypothetical protein